MAPVHDTAHARNRILDAAERLFARHGFDGTSTAHLARAAGVPKGLLFYYFPTKPDILTTLLDERLTAAAWEPGPLVVAGDPVRTLLNLADRVRSDRDASGVLRDVIWHEARIRPEVRAVLSRYRHSLHDAITSALRASVPAVVEGRALHAAAAAWAAIITARPLDPPPHAGTGDRPVDATSLQSVARLLSAGLLSTATTT
ncbi:TetR/AcrR family transcriptional regulator [Microbacterium soli]|uniref:HTH tetR-type domain-containing protein n=1 Tax=Microbacterium soli TaxID=446075 RepID=A0ABP7NFZ6_9MICO